MPETKKASASTPAKKRKKYGFYKSVPLVTTVGGAVSDAFAAFEELATEMGEIASNMENANMGHMPKCEMASATAGELENLSEPDVPELLADLPVNSSQMVPRRKGKGTSRATRLSNATGLLQDAISALNDWEPEGHDDDEESETKKGADEAKEQAEELANELEEAANVDVEFPGMYG